MSQYTTGELAKRCGVSVRTVQYYDSRNILTPSALSEGGRRLYSEEDLKRLQIICFLREAGVSVESIGELLEEKEPQKPLTLLLDRQEQIIRTELEEQKKRLSVVESIRKGLRETPRSSVDFIGDVACKMKEKKKLQRMRLTMLLAGLPVTALQWVSVILWIAKDIWWPFALWVAVAATFGVWVSLWYFGRVAYICPECHTLFRPRFKEAFWASHTPTLRKLTCTCCGIRSFCMEVYYKKELEDYEQNR